MADTNKGILSLTYHLTFDDDLTAKWLAKRYDEIFADFGIDAEQAAAILDINDQLMTRSAEETIEAWVDLMYDDLLVAKERLW